MLGLVLCGGQSTRMGADKGLIIQDNITWALTAADKLAEFGIDVAFSINSKQESDYEKSLEGRQLIKDNATISVKGPLSGLLAAHINHSTADIFVLACDLLLMQKQLLHEVLLASSTQPDFDAYLFKNDNEYEPLCGIYKATALSVIYNMHLQYSLARHSMKYALEQLNVFSIPVKEQNLAFFKNFNSHAERNGL